MGPEIGTCIGIDASVVWMSSSPFSSADDVEEETYVDDPEQFDPPPFRGDPGQSSSYPPPQDPSGSAPPPAQSGEEHFAYDLAQHLFAPHQPPPHW
jgi:hypothetical protein